MSTYFFLVYHKKGLFNMLPKSRVKPGFLLIEIMVAFLLLIVAGSIMGLYLGYCQNQQKRAQNKLYALLVAGKTIDCLQEGSLNSKPDNGNYQIVIKQTPLNLTWDDGTAQAVWLGQVTVIGHDKKALVLETILEKKAL